MADAITLDHLVRKFEKLKEGMDSGEFDHGEYDQRLARMIAELRDRKIDADRDAIKSTLDDLQQRGVIPQSVREHVESRLGLK
jgi:hypothetical protein